MASHSRTPKNLPVFAPKKTHFVKIVMNDIMVNQKISIPEKFERKHRSSLSRSVLLKVPNGDVWEVALSKMNGQVFFQDGWKKFSDHYSIKYGDFIVFEYEGNSQFSVFIIDKSATEINYPETANPSFTIQMLPTHLPPRSTLSVPSWFGKKYMTEEGGDVALTVLGEGSWPSNYRLCQTCKGSRIRLTEGWGAFAKMNNLAIGDICSFHFLTRDKVEFQVSIYRADHDRK